MAKGVAGHDNGNANGAAAGRESLAGSPVEPFEACYAPPQAAGGLQNCYDYGDGVLVHDEADWGQTTVVGNSFAPVAPGCAASEIFGC